MRSLTFLLLCAPLAGCGDDAPAADAADPGFLYQTLGLGDAPSGPNGLGTLAPTGDGLGPGPGAADGLGRAPGAAGEPGAGVAAGCFDACNRLVECSLDNGETCLAECEGIRAEIGEALAQAVLECVLTERCNRISRCIEDAVDGPSESTPPQAGSGVSRPVSAGTAVDSAP